MKRKKQKRIGNIQLNIATTYPKPKMGIGFCEGDSGNPFNILLGVLDSCDPCPVVGLKEEVTQENFLNGNPPAMFCLNPFEHLGCKYPEDEFVKDPILFTPAAFDNFKNRCPEGLTMDDIQSMRKGIIDSFGNAEVKQYIASVKGTPSKVVDPQLVH